MLQCHAGWFSVLQVKDAARKRAKTVMAEALEIPAGTMPRRDIEAPTALLLALKPKRIFEIGSQKRASSEMMSRLLSETAVGALVSSANRAPLPG